MAIIGAIGALAAAGVGAYAANSQAQAAKQNNAAQQENYLYQRRIDAENRRIAEENRRVGLAPTRDARGNVTEYIDGVGWVERPTDRTRAIITTSDNEELRRLREDAPRSRMRRENTFRRQISEGGQADAMLGRAALTEQTPDQVRSNILRSGIANAVAAPNALRSGINMQALRGGSGGETALAELGRQTMTDRRAAIANADATSPGAFADAEDSRLSGPLQRYLSLRSAATNPDDVPFAPSSLADSLMASRSRQQAVAPQAIAQSAALSTNIRPPVFSAVDDRLGVRVGSVASGLEGFADSPAIRRLFERGASDSSWRLQPGQFSTGRAQAGGTF